MIELAFFSPILQRYQRFLRPYFLYYSTGILREDHIAHLQNVMGCLFLLLWISMVGMNHAAIFLMISLVIWCAPLLYLMHQKHRCHEMLESTMPFYLELITLMIDSGVSVSMGIELICQHSNRDDLFIRSGKMVLRQKASGMSFEKAVELCIFPLKNNLLEDFYAFVVESERSGMPLKAALQSLSISMWDSLICKLETKAQKAPVKILFPLVAFIFPVVFILLFAPLAHQLMHVL